MFRRQHPRDFIMRRLLASTAWFDGEGESGGSSGEQKKPKGSVPDVPMAETFSREYVSELRSENKGYRLARDNERARAETALAEAAALKVAVETAKTEAQQAADARVIRAELKALAIKAGMVDLDGLKLLDISKLTLDENGDVKGAEDLMKTAKEAKPYLFDARKSSSSSDDPPKNDDKAKRATEMTDEEYAAARREMTKSR